MNVLRIILTGKKGFVLTFSLILSLTITLQAQDPGKKLPLHPDLISGTLENGLTYYIHRNGKPEKRAELRLVVKAGSILESDAQQGLAHFVERSEEQRLNSSHVKISYAVF